jgi:hypothetical protein
VISSVAAGPLGIRRRDQKPVRGVFAAVQRAEGTGLVQAGSSNCTVGTRQGSAPLCPIPGTPIRHLPRQAMSRFPESLCMSTLALALALWPSGTSSLVLAPDKPPEDKHPLSQRRFEKLRLRVIRAARSFSFLFSHPRPSVDSCSQQATHLLARPSSLFPSLCSYRRLRLLIRR